MKYYKPLKCEVILLQVVCVIFLLGWHVTDSVGSNRRYSPIFWHVDNVEKSAEVVLIAKIDIVKAPYDVLGKEFYTMKPVKLLKGEITENDLLVIITNIDSTEGIPPSIESKFSYMLFLKQVVNKNDYAKTGLKYYKLVGNWKGIISLDRGASERRSVEAIRRQYGIDVQAAVLDFIDAIKYIIFNEVDKKHSQSALKIYQSLRSK